MTCQKFMKTKYLITVPNIDKIVPYVFEIAQKDVKLWSKIDRNYYILVHSQNLFHVHQGSTVPHHCIKHEQNPARDLGDITDCYKTES